MSHSRTAQGHARIGPGRKRRTFKRPGRPAARQGPEAWLLRRRTHSGCCFLAVRGSRQPRAAQAASVNPGHPSRALFQELPESVAPEGTARDEMLRQYPFGIWPPRPARHSTNDRSHTENTPHAVASDATAYRVGMKLKRVAIPAKGAAETDYGYLDEGDEVLKCLNLSRYATLFGFVAWAFENPPRHADAHAHSPANSHGRKWGKLPWRKMLRYSGKLGKKAEKVTGEEHALTSR